MAKGRGMGKEEHMRVGRGLLWISEGSVGILDILCPC